MVSWLLQMFKICSVFNLYNNMYSLCWVSCILYVLQRLSNNVFEIYSSLYITYHFGAATLKKNSIKRWFFAFEAIISATSPKLSCFCRFFLRKVISRIFLHFFIEISTHHGLGGAILEKKSLVATNWGGDALRNSIKISMMSNRQKGKYFNLNFPANYQHRQSSV